jgi:Mrp family chromosome partitioning ATPase
MIWGHRTISLAQLRWIRLIRKTDDPYLDIIISGPVPPNPAELLSKQAMSDMISDLRKRYDFIIIDTPPLGVVSDAFQLMQYSDVSMYLVRQGYSRLNTCVHSKICIRKAKFRMHVYC